MKPNPMRKWLIRRALRNTSQHTEWVVSVRIDDNLRPFYLPLHVFHGPHAWRDAITYTDRATRHNYFTKEAAA